MLGLVAGNILPTAPFIVSLAGVVCVGRDGGLCSACSGAVWCFLDFLNQILLNKFLSEDHYTGKTLHLPHFNSDSLL